LLNIHGRFALRVCRCENTSVKHLVLTASEGRLDNLTLLI
jgi:hypothetical protein